MKNSKLLKFVLVGYVVAQIVEFQFNILVAKNYGNWIFTLFYYPIVLAAIYYIGRLIDKLFKNKKVADIIYYFATTAFGLFGMEWVIIGNSPWGNPDANQLGMLSFWAAAFFIPRIFIDGRPRIKPLKEKIVRYITTYTIITVTLGLALPGDFKLIPIIWGEIIGYSTLHWYYLSYLQTSSQK